MPNNYVNINFSKLNLNRNLPLVGFQCFILFIFRTKNDGPSRPSQVGPEGGRPDPDGVAASRPELHQQPPPQPTERQQRRHLRQLEVFFAF